MGKRRRSSSNWWTESTGGVVHWLIAVVAVVAIVVTASLAAFALSRDTVPIAGATPRPVGTYSSGEVAKPATLFIGDSYSAGTGSSEKRNRWTSVVSRELNLMEVNFSAGGTGYTVAGDAGRRFVDSIVKFEDAEPVYVVISGGRNDGPSLWRDEPGIAAETIRAAQTRWPTAKVVVASPIWAASEVPQWFPQSVDAVRDAAAETGATFLDLGQPLVGHPEWVKTDDPNHPNDEGYAVIADVFQQQWRAAGLPG